MPVTVKSSSRQVTMVEGCAPSSVRDVDVYGAIRTRIVSSNVEQRISTCCLALREHAVI